MKNTKSNKGYTLKEIIVVLGLAVFVSVIAFAGFVVWHFICKIW